MQPPRTGATAKNLTAATAAATVCRRMPSSATSSGLGRFALEFSPVSARLVGAAGRGDLAVSEKLNKQAERSVCDDG